MIAVLLYTDIPLPAREAELTLLRPKTECVSSPWGGSPPSGGTYAPISMINPLVGTTFWLGAIVHAPKESGEELTTPEVPAALAEIRDAFSLNTARLAEVLQVTRQTIYNWADGKTVDEVNRRRVAAVRELARTWIGDQGKPMGPVITEEFDGESLFSMLCMDVLDERSILFKFDSISARITAAEANRPASASELAAKYGIEPLSEEEYRRNLQSVLLRGR